MLVMTYRYFQVIRYYSYYSNKNDVLKDCNILSIFSVLFLFPARLYTNRKFRRAWLGMAYSENFRLFTARMLCLALILFHLVYYALFPLEKGIMLSSIYVFFSLASKKNMILLQTIRQSRMIVMVLCLHYHCTFVYSTSAFGGSNISVYS